MKKTLRQFWFMILLASSAVYALQPDTNTTQIKHVCTLPTNKILRIGCTHRCGKPYIAALNRAAEELHYRIRIFTLRKGKRNYDSVLSSVDAILSPGGHDIDPKYYTQFLSQKEKNKTYKLFNRYGKSNKKGKIRDQFEFGLFQRYFSDSRYKNIPVLGVCYGMQMLASVHHIPLYVDLPANIGIPARRKIYDQTQLDSNSHLLPYMGSHTFSGYKNHHQAINLEFYKKHKSLYPDAMITGISNHGKIAEVLEFADRPAVGVQFHPERSNAHVKKALYKKFLTDACNSVRLSTPNQKIKYGKMVHPNNKKVASALFTIKNTDSRELKKWKTRAQNGDPHALNMLGYFFQTGSKGLFRDYKKSIQCYQKTVSVSDRNKDRKYLAEAYYHLGYLFQVTKDYKKAYEMYVDAQVYGSKNAKKQLNDFCKIHKDACRD